MHFWDLKKALNNLSNFIGKYAYTNEHLGTIIVRYSVGADKSFVIENKEEIEKAVEEAKEAVVYAKMAIDAFGDLF